MGACVLTTQPSWAEISQVPRAALEPPAVGEPEHVQRPTQGTEGATGSAAAKQTEPENSPNAAAPTAAGAGAAGSAQSSHAATASAGSTPPATDPATSNSEAAPTEAAATPAVAAPTGPQPTGPQPTGPQPTVVRVEAPPAPAVAPCEPPARPKFSSMLLIEGLAKYGGLVEGPDLSDDEAPTTSSRGGHLGAQATLGFMPAGKAFTMAGRLRGGAYLGSNITSGSIGASVLFGANFARQPEGKTFSYALGGFGVEYIAEKNQDILTLHITGGTVVNGLNFGADIDLGGNDEFALFMFGVHMGWGRLF